MVTLTSWELRLEFTIPGAPVSKERPRYDRLRGRTYTPKATQDAEEKVKWAYRAAEGPLKRAPIPRGTRVAIEIEAYLPDDRGRDWDNIGKLVSDALNGLAYDDDSQIKEAHVSLDVDRKNPRTIVRVYSGTSREAA